MEIVIFIIYWIAGYWAAGVVIYKKDTTVISDDEVFLRKLSAGVFVGWILIPIALIKKLSKR